MAHMGVSYRCLGYRPWTLREIFYNNTGIGMVFPGR